MLNYSVAPSLFCVVLAALTLSACASAPPLAAPACAMSDEDGAWIDRSVAAWRFATREIGGFEPPVDMQSVFFDADCVWVSSDALGGASAPTWRVSAHAGVVTLPDGEEMPAGVTSFTTDDGRGARYFVMPMPSVWAAGGVSNATLGLETMMTGVLLHEGAHVVQIPTYGARIDRLSEANNLPDDFNDDSMQRRFEADDVFAASIERETELLFAAAVAPDDGEARRLAFEARELMRARAARSFVGEAAYWAEAEDVWLTFEGSAQWLGYQWVTSPRDGAAPHFDAMPGFDQRSRWWSQKQGLALFMALSRLDDGAWRTTVFGDGSKTGLELIDEAIAADGPR
ncbi:MAG: hypothetical protein DCF16_06925 [Alphaproteobacteria bacterium]|nr:MAG: hypothetical protein DCF16_06925 [Alphaproteobacteria bacterium]